MAHCLIAAHEYFVAVGNSDLNYYFNEILPKHSHVELLRRVTAGLFSLGFCAGQPPSPGYGTQGNAN